MNHVYLQADLLLSYGYEDDLRALTAHIPRRCQCLLMSATSRFLFCPLLFRLLFCVLEWLNVVLFSPSFTFLDEYQWLSSFKRLAIFIVLVS